MKTVNVDCSVLDDVIKELYQYHRGDARAVERICTALVENEHVDQTWGHLMYSKDGNYIEGGMEVDAAILDQLEQYVTATIKTL